MREGFADAVMQRIGDGSSGLGVRLMRWAGGGAIAAAVAVFALVSTRPAVNAPDPAAALATASPGVSAPAAPVTRIATAPLQPAFEFAQPASLERFDSGVIALPRYQGVRSVERPAEMLGPYVLLTSPQQSARQPEPQVAPQP
jgi:hypothetical protein